LVLVALLVGYLFGSFPSADLVTRIATQGQVDIRSTGSGNPGALNATNVLGKRWGALVLVLDVAKGLFAGILGRSIGVDAGAYAGASASIAGHVFPVWTGFRGGKGVATSAGACLAVFPAYFPINFLAAIFSGLRSGRAETGMKVGCAIWVVAAAAWWLFDLPNLWGPPAGFGLFAFSVVGAGLVFLAFAIAPSALPATEA
jgi:glycerol-3-phosphate acyltransferase PlsY